VHALHLDAPSQPFRSTFSRAVDSTAAMASRSASPITYASSGTNRSSAVIPSTGTSRLGPPRSCDSRRTTEVAWYWLRSLLKAYLGSSCAGISFTGVE
jgi:hypothetical protein